MRKINPKQERRFKGNPAKRNTLWIGLIFAIAVLCIAALFIMNRLQKSGELVCIYQDGSLLYTFPLHEDRTITIPAEHGGFNTIVIEHGAVRISEASCPDQICVRHKPIQETTDPIICLPNKLVVQVETKQEPALDGVS